MSEISIGPRAEDFIWAGGIEDTFVPQTRPRHRALDEYELIGHYQHWRTDLALARELGLQALRWGVPWYRVEPQPGVFDWSWTDQVIPYLVEELRITPIIDLMHYGCPLWLEREFANPRYPVLVANYAAAFAERYRQLVRWYTPLNEPLINALMCGQRGVWPPYMRGQRGYVRIMLQLVRGMQHTVEALRAIDAGARMVFVEAAGLNRPEREELQALAVEEQRRGYLAFDLFSGMVRADHPLFDWLLQHGASAEELAALAGHALDLDIVGINFYPQWSTKQISLDPLGRIKKRNVEKDGAGFAELIRDYHARYRKPIMITETSAFGAERVRRHWLDSSITAVRQLRSEGVPVIGYTWFPLFTMIEWRYRLGQRPAEDYRIELGLYTLGNADQRWLPTSLVEQLRAAIAQPGESVGDLEQEHVPESGV